MRRSGARRSWYRGRSAAAGILAAVSVLAACDDTTEPPLASGSLSFEWVTEGGTTPSVWSVEGSCGSAGFELGSSTCAVGSRESLYWAVVGVQQAGEDAFGTLTVVTPREAGTCEPSAAPGTTCAVEFVPTWTTSSGEPPPFYLMTSGTITVAVAEEDGVERITGTFEGTAEDPNGEMAPIVITNGTFDVELFN